jgi:hypothetical protein
MLRDDCRPFGYGRLRNWQNGQACELTMNLQAWLAVASNVAEIVTAVIAIMAIFLYTFQ